MTLHDESYRREAKRQEALNLDAQKINEAEINEIVSNMSELITFLTSPPEIFAEGSMIRKLTKEGGSGDCINDLKDLWGCDESVKEGIREAAYSDQTIALLRAIGDPKSENVENIYTLLGKLIYDDVDNYLFKIAEDSNK